MSTTELEPLQAGPATGGGAVTMRRTLSQRARASLLDWLILGLFTGASFGVFVLHAVHAANTDRVFLGADGRFPYDQAQYLSWATDGGHHGLIGNLYGPGSHVFLHPLWLLTGVLHVAGGLSYPLLMALWKLVAVIAAFVAVRRYARSLLSDNRWMVAAALVLALFMLSPSWLILNKLRVSMPGNPPDFGLLGGETFAVDWMTGSFPTALAVAASVALVMLMPRLLGDGPGSAGGPSRRVMLIACASGATAAWLHPWQGLTLLAIMVGLVLWERPSRRHMRLALPALATAAPVAYYALLPSIDVGWAQAHAATANNYGDPGVGATAIALAPIALLLIPGYFGRSRSTSERILRLWPLAIVALYLLAPAQRIHIWGGVSIPAAVLIVRGWRFIGGRGPWIARGVLAALTIAVVGGVFTAAGIHYRRKLTSYREGVERTAELTRDDARALDRISQLGSGSILTTWDVGGWAPVVTGDRTWNGHPVWSTRFFQRAGMGAHLFDRSVQRTPQWAIRLVLSSGARFVLEPCGSTGPLDPLLLPLGFKVQRIGCATLYVRG